MALELANSGHTPLSVDGYDSVYLNVKGGEVAAIVGTGLSADLAAALSDGGDGYVPGANPITVVTATRPVVTTNLQGGERPLGLVDEGIAGYGTLFGSVVGGIAGKKVTGTVLGPHTAEGSGKLTFWDKPGTYAITLDAVADDATTGLQPTNPTLAIGAALYATAGTGVLTPVSGDSFESDIVVGRFMNFETYKGGSLVRTPVGFTTSNTNGVPAARLARALIHFNPPIA